MARTIPDRSGDAPEPVPATEGMQWVSGGSRFTMGSADFYPEERPVREVSVSGYWMDECPVTAAEFRRFVRERLLVLHDDAAREFDYTAGAEDALQQAPDRKWTVINIKNDWATVFDDVAAS